MSRSSRRYYRTVVLGVLAMAALVWMAMDQFGISRREMWELFLDTLLLVGLAIGAAVLTALIWVGLRKLLDR